MLVADIMSTRVVTVNVSDSLCHALTTLQKERIRHLPVLDGDRLAGILTDRDLRDMSPAVLREENIERLSKLRVGEVMKSPPITAHPLDPVEDAARLMYVHRIGCLPVVKEGALVGILTETDILRCLVELMGVSRPSSRLEVVVPDTPGHLASVASVIRDFGVNIISVITPASKKEGFRSLVFRIATIDPRQIKQAVTALGYEVIWPPDKR